VSTPSSHKGSGHVGDLAAAFVDEQLDLQRRDLVLVHIAGCLLCRDEVDHQRRLKTRLRALGGPCLPPDLMSRLSAFGGLPGGGSGGLPAAPVPAVGLRAAHRPTARRDAQRALRLLAGAASLVLVGAGTAVAAASDGQPASPTRSVAPASGVGRSATVPESARRDPGDDGSDLLQMPMSDATFATVTASLHR
jgi:hypothetical protein